MQILIPMAGAGRRFAETGYRLPKPLIPVNNTPMIQAVIENLGKNNDFVFVVQKAMWEQHQDLFEQSISIARSTKIVFSDGLTQGAAESCLLAEPLLDPEQSLMIANCDQMMDWDSLQFFQWFENTTSDGTILTFDSDSTKNSYVKIDDQGWVTVAREKEVISNLATTGVYIWRKAKDFANAAREMIHKNHRVNNEFYVCPVYNENVSMGQKINIYHINKHWPIGTPEDLESYLEQLA
jgi:NDP-sugar pyrophosphorylase family protein